MASTHFANWETEADLLEREVADLEEQVRDVGGVITLVADADELLAQAEGAEELGGRGEQADDPHLGFLRRARGVDNGLRSMSPWASILI